MRGEPVRRSRMGSRTTRKGPPLAWWLLAALLAVYAAMTLGVAADASHRMARAALYAALLAGALALCASRALTPVSYTHLTLPTICSV